MIVFPGIIAESARQAGIKVPNDPDDFDPNKFPHFALFCSAQLARPITSWGAHWDNAKVIARVPKNKLKTITMDELLAMGFVL